MQQQRDLVPDVPADSARIGIDRILIGFACAAALAAGVVLGTGLDGPILTWFRTTGDLADPIGAPGIETFARDVTAVGSFGVLATLVLSVLAYLSMTGRGGIGKTIFAIAASGWAISTTLKILVGRVRPDVVPHAVYVGDASLPSGHSMMAAVVYFTLAAAVCRSHESPRVRRLALGLAIGLTLAVGLSRLYLGVHWPTDVLTGWALGAAWVFIGWRIADARR